MKTTKLFWPARSKPSFADWITQHLGTSRWHVGETALGSTAISPESATALQAQYDTLYGKDGDGARTPTGFSEIATPIANLPAWLRWLDENPWARSSDYIDAAVANIKRAGMHDPILGYARPSEILDRLQRIALGADRLQPALNIEKAFLPHDSLAPSAHDRVRSPSQIRGDLARGIFRGALPGIANETGLLRVRRMKGGSGSP